MKDMRCHACDSKEFEVKKGNYEVDVNGRHVFVIADRFMCVFCRKCALDGSMTDMIKEKLKE